MAWSRDSKYFDDVEVIYVADKFQVFFFKYMNLLMFHDNPKISEFENSQRFVLDLCLYIEDESNLKLVRLLCLSLA